jgi:hypothetical protein
MHANPDGFFFPSGNKFNVFMLFRCVITPSPSERFPPAQTS